MYKLISRRIKKKIIQGIFNAKITAMSHDGRGITKVDDKIIFIPFALKGEKVEFKYTNRKFDDDEVELVSVLKSSHERVIPPCQYFGICGGCALQHMSPDAQITFKQNVLLNHFKHFGLDLVPQKVLPPLRSQSTESYRTKARLSVRYVHKKSKVLVGFKERKWKFVAEIDHCKVLHRSIGENLVSLQNFIHSLSIYKKIPMVEVAIDDKITSLIIRHLTAFNDADIKKIISYAKVNNFWIYLQSKGPDTVKRIYPEAESVPQQMSYTLDEYDVEIFFEPNDFTQVNPDINRKMLKEALRLLDVNKKDTVLDLFCGLGNFSLPIATKSHYVVGIEGDIEMTKRAAINAKHNNLSNIEFHQVNLFKDISQHAWLQTKRFNKILLDPPRSGAKMVCRQIEKINPTRIVYISCDPATLARDTDILVNKKGYTLISTGVMDMFPHTTHIESIAAFEKLS